MAAAVVVVPAALGTPNCPVSAQFQTGVAASPIVSTCSVTGPSGTVVQIRQGSSLLQSGGRIDIGTERNVTADLHTATLSIAEPVAGDHGEEYCGSDVCRFALLLLLLLLLCGVTCVGRYAYSFMISSISL